MTNQDDKAFISVVDLKTRTMVGRVPVAGGSRGIVASPDGKRLFAMERAEPVVVVIDSVTDAIVDRIRLQGGHTQPGYKLRISLDGGTLVTCSGVGGGESIINILRMADLHGTQHVLKAGRAPMGFAFAPDGRTALIANDGDGTVTVVDLQAGVVTGTFKGGTGIENLSYY